MMNWRESRFGKVWTSISTHGLVGGLQDALARWARSKPNAPQDVLGDYGWVLTQDQPAALAPPSSGPLTINWLICGFGEEKSGGLLNILRTVYHLERAGHTLRIYTLDKRSMSGALLTESARKNYFPIKTTIEVFRGQMADSDALVATNWISAYAVRGVGNTARKFYFVQDLENLFYAEGSICEFARQTYRWGFYGITLGPWIAEMLRRNFAMECSPFGFSFDREAYSVEGERHFSDGKKRVLFYARPSTERRGFELGVLALSLVAKKMPETEFVLVGFPAQAVRLPFPAILPGVLAPSELAGLYRSCQIALVLSHTNLSLLPLELMACGCAVVSNSGSNVEWLLTDHTAQIANPTPEALADAVLTLLENEELRAQKTAAGLALAQRTSWLTSIKEIESAFYRGLKVPVPERSHV